MLSRKSQAALEFLTTYGWALIVIVVMIGAMIYFGVFDPKRLIPESCSVSSGFVCEDFQVSVTSTPVGTISVKIINNLDRLVEYDTSTTTLMYKDQPFLANCPDNGRLPVRPQASGAAVSCQEITAGDFSAAGLRKNSREKIQFRTIYYYQGSTFPHVLDGELVASVR